MKTKKSAEVELKEIEVLSTTENPTIFSSDLLTPEEERNLLADFWETKCELVRALVRQYQNFAVKGPLSSLGPWLSLSKTTVSNPFAVLLQSEGFMIAMYI